MLNYAEKYQPELLEWVGQESLTSPLIANPTNISWSGAKTFHLTSMNVSGYKEHGREGGWNTGIVSQADETFQITHDRDVEFLVDKADVDETNEIASIGNITRAFMEQQAVPEMDAYAFSSMAERAISQAAAKYLSTDAVDKDTVYEIFKKLMLPLRRYIRTTVGWATSAWMDALEQSPRFSRTIDVTNLNGPSSIETRVAVVDGVRIIEVFDENRFMTEYDYTDGFAPTNEAKQINLLLASTRHNFVVPKITSIYNFAPGTHTKGDGYLYQNRSMWDCFTIKNHNDIENPFYDTISVNYAG